MEKRTGGRDQKRDKIKEKERKKQKQRKNLGRFDPLLLGGTDAPDSLSDTFFHRVLSCSNHMLHCLLPDIRSHVYQLRSRPHDCILTANDDTRNFLCRLLHCDIYWLVTLLSSLSHCLRCVMSSFLLNEYIYIYIVKVSSISLGG